MLGSKRELAAVLLDQLDDGIWVVGARDAGIIDVNVPAAGRLGHDPRALIGSSFLDLVTPPLPAEGWRLLVDRTLPGRRTTVPARLRHAEGRELPVELTVSRHQAERDEIVLVVARTPDSAGAGESRLRSQRQLLESIIEVLDEGVAVIDPDGRIESVNDSFCALLGLAAERLVDHSVFDPPWTTLDEDLLPVAAERSPAVVALRAGHPVRGQVQCVERGRNDRTWFRINAEPLHDRDGATDGAVITLTDMTEVKRTEAHLRRLTTTDPLTGLSTRVRIGEIVESAVGDLDEDEPVRVGVIHLDLDNFRTVNETFGPGVGDRVLVSVADRLRDLEERRLEIGRVGVDEFLVVLVDAGPSLTFDARLRRLAEEIQRRLERPLVIDGLELRLTGSVGIARAPEDASTSLELMAAADRALAAGRHEGRSQLRFYESTLDERTRTGLALDRDLRLATAQRALEVHYQPILDLRDGSVAAAEALVRWHHPERGPVPPSVFIPTAEATGAIGAISDLVMTTVAEDLARWSAEDLFPGGARISVNISAAEFEQRGFVERLAGTLAQAGVSPSSIELEITESLLVQDLRSAATRLEELDELGFLIALDDFGTGYSSLSYLHTLPLHTLKIDRRFVGDLRDGRSGTITRAILSLAHNLGIRAVAEGVETESQRHFLAEAGCDMVQGFLFAPPLPRPAFERFLRDRGVPVAVGA